MSKLKNCPADWTARNGEGMDRNGVRTEMEDNGEKRSTERKGEHKDRNGVRIETENNGGKRGCRK